MIKTIVIHTPSYTQAFTYHLGYLNPINHSIETQLDIKCLPQKMDTAINFVYKILAEVPDDWDKMLVLHCSTTTLATRTVIVSARNRTLLKTDGLDMLITLPGAFLDCIADVNYSQSRLRAHLPFLS